MSHNHQHEVKNYNQAFSVGILLNVVFVLIEAGYGLSINSLALIADAGHNLSDVAGLLLVNKRVRSCNHAFELIGSIYG
jgi:cobalt-zinc-cadmium efflux system protein